MKRPRRAHGFPPRTAAALLFFAVFPLCRHYAFGTGSFTWIGGNTTWADNLNANSWNPADEPGPDDSAFFTVPSTVSLSTDNSVHQLFLSGGANLDLNGFNLAVAGPISIPTGHRLLVTHYPLHPPPPQIWSRRDHFV